MKHILVKPSATIISLAAFREAKGQLPKKVGRPQTVVDIDCWYHQQQVEVRD